MPPAPLAIIVPAYRARHLRAALDSLARQTNQDFRVYVFDDASPDDLRAAFGASLLHDRANAEFHRFEQNLGGTSLVAQWNRCVRATGDEPWVWVFSDDDLADPRCAERFADALRTGALAGNVCRFDTATIDNDGAVTDLHPPHPPLEMAVNFAYHRLRFQRRSFAPEYLFRRTAFEANGGFVDFPFALGSDDASWIVFAGSTPIVTLPDALVYWRFSGENTSLLQRGAALPKFLALADFCAWIRERFRGSSPQWAGSSQPSRICMDALAQEWLRRSIWALPPGFPLLRVPELAAGLQYRGFGSRSHWIARLMYVLLVIKARTAGRQLGHLFQLSGN